MKGCIGWQIPCVRIGNMLAEIEKILTELSGYSAVISPRQQPFDKLFFAGALPDPNLAFFPSGSDLQVDGFKLSKGG
jgi:hypothetical protein